MRAAVPRPSRPRRGVTLVEMLVVVALVILMMVILVQIFQSATGAMSASRSNSELDVTLRQLDTRIKQDLLGCTARFTPPLDPSLKLGYFEYGENAFADAQGEDTDDYIAFTTKAPEGQVFTGRVFIPNTLANVAANLAVQPVTVTSQLAEVIYFLRNGNLYRRVFLIAPQRQGSLAANTFFSFPGLGPGATVSWLGANDISAHPAPIGSMTPRAPIANDLGDLTNREYRAFRPRFRGDFFSNANFAAGMNNTQDGIDDDFNGDDIPDFYPTLYPRIFTSGMVNEVAYPNAANPRTLLSGSYDVYPFPYIFPGMYSQPAPGTATTGWIRSLDPSGKSFNHSPLILNLTNKAGIAYSNIDNLAVPDLTQTNTLQTYWGFPTWRESLCATVGGNFSTWLDPVQGLTSAGSVPVQANGLRPFPPAALPATTLATAGFANNMLPPAVSQVANDGVGSAAFARYVNAPGVWDDDLILTNVRSFDIKAYDPDAPIYGNSTATPPVYFPSGYYDLGYGLKANSALATSTPTFLWDDRNSPRGFGHAGRMPPLGDLVGTATVANDFRINPSRPYNPFNSTANNNNYNPALPPFLNLVGDNQAGVIRLNRVWDSWSTDYTNAPDVDINLNGLQQNYPSGVFLPIYPSFPPPYPSPLRGIQIQVRVADPRNEHVKVLTIRQDFTDKL